MISLSPACGSWPAPTKLQGEDGDESTSEPVNGPSISQATLCLKTYKLDKDLSGENVILTLEIVTGKIYASLALVAMR